MSSQLPPDDQPPDEWRRLATHEEAEAATPEPSLTDPASVAHLFYDAIREPGVYENALAFLTTPESHPMWGDFTEAARLLAEIDSPGISTMVNEAVGDPDVVYAKVLRGVTTSYQVLDDQFVDGAAVITLVWRSDFGRWMVHALGDYVRPEDVPHG